MSVQHYRELFDDSFIIGLVDSAKESGISAREMAEKIYFPALVGSAPEVVAQAFEACAEGLLYDVFCRCYELYGEACPFAAEEFALEEHTEVAGVYVEMIHLPKTHFEPDNCLQAVLIFDVREGAVLRLVVLERNDRGEEVYQLFDEEGFLWLEQGVAPDGAQARLERVLQIALEEDVDLPTYAYISARCPLCGTTYQLGLTDEELEGYRRFREEDEDLEDAIPALNGFEREFLMTGMCPNCQASVFHKDLPTDMSRWARE